MWKKHWKIFSGIILFIILDQLLKVWALSQLKNQDPIIIVKNIFEFYYLENRGAAFGILQNRQIIFFILTILVLVAVTWFYLQLPDTRRYVPLRICYMFLMAGAIGNFIDRITRGYVIDFCYFKAINFPVFNIADIYVTVTVVLLLILILFYYKEDELSFLQWKKEKK